VLAYIAPNSYAKRHVELRYMPMPTISIPTLLGLTLGVGVVWLWPASQSSTPVITSTQAVITAHTAVTPRASWETFTKTDALLRLPELAGLLADATEETISELAEKFLTLTPEPTELEWQLLFRRWADFSPQAAFGFAQEHETKPARRALLAAMAWAEVDAPAALQALAGAPQHDIQSFLMSVAPRDPLWAWQIGEERGLWLWDVGVFMAALQRRDPASVAAFVNARQHPWDPGALAKEWYAVDPAAALAWAQSLPGLQGQKAYGTLLQSIAKRDPEAAASLLAKAPHSLPFLTAASQTATSLAKQDPAAALAWVRGNFTGAAQQYALFGVIKGLTESNPEAALALLNEVGWQPKLDGADKSSDNSRTLRPEDPDMVIGVLLGKMAVTQPQKVLDALAQSDQSSKYGGEMGLAVGAWMKRDLPDFLKYLSQTYSDRSISGAVDPLPYENRLAESMAEQTPVSECSALWAKCRELNLPESIALSLAREIASRLATQDSASGKNFIATLPSEWQAKATSAWLKAVAAVRPLEALEAMWTLDGSPPYNLASTLAEKYPLHMRDQLQAHAETSSAVALANDFVATWMTTEPEVASSWVNDLPPSKLRDAAASGLIQGLFRQAAPDVQAAVAWLNVIEDPSTYLTQCEACYSAMDDESDASKAAFVEGLHLNPAEKLKLTGADTGAENPDPFAR
jgi:hypothetical protein